jgi:hypothetical protein
MVLKEGETPLKTGSGLGELEDQISGAYGTEFVSCGHVCFNRFYNFLFKKQTIRSKAANKRWSKEMGNLQNQGNQSEHGRLSHRPF